MTRRVLAYREPDGMYIVSQEFNGDKRESAMFNMAVQISTTWDGIVELFAGQECQTENFLQLVEKAEQMFGYEHIGPEVLRELPATEECWLFANNKLYLHSCYGELVGQEGMDDESDDIENLCEDFSPSEIVKCKEFLTRFCRMEMTNGRCCAVDDSDCALCPINHAYNLLM